MHDNRSDDPSRTDAHGQPALEATFHVRDDGDAECLMFPRGATTAERLTAWISARDDSVRSLAEMR